MFITNAKVKKISEYSLVRIFTVQGVRKFMQVWFYCRYSHHRDRGCTQPGNASCRNWIISQDVWHATSSCCEILCRSHQCRLSWAGRTGKYCSTVKTRCSHLQRCIPSNPKLLAVKSCVNWVTLHVHFLFLQSYNFEWLKMWNIFNSVFLR